MRISILVIFFFSYSCFADNSLIIHGGINVSNIDNYLTIDKLSYPDSHKKSNKLGYTFHANYQIGMNKYFSILQGVGLETRGDVESYEKKASMLTPYYSIKYKANMMYICFPLRLQLNIPFYNNYINISTGMKIKILASSSLTKESNLKGDSYKSDFNGIFLPYDYNALISFSYERKLNYRHFIFLLVEYNRGLSNVYEQRVDRLYIKNMSTSFSIGYRFCI
jgi:hypothetical protein